ncbi:MAG TPA: phosphatase PAP2 family protein [Tepidisphaeraceae bacterium]
MKRHLHRAFHWLRRFDLVLLMGVLLVVSGGWAFVQVLDEVQDGDTKHFDQWVIDSMQGARDNKVMLDVARDITALGGVTVLTLFTAGVVGFLWIEKKYHALVLLLVSTLGACILTFVLKDFIDRDRPDPLGHLAYTLTKSFPSGHASLSAAVYLTLGTLLARLTVNRWLKVYFIVMAMLLTGLVGVSRVFLKVHWPTDVLAGWSLGLMWAILCWSVARWLQHRGKVEQAV